MIFPSNREIAVQNGHKYYRSDKPCRNGHTDLRYTLSSVCVMCNREKAKRNSENVKRIALNHGLGLVTSKLGIHPDDLATVESFIKALLLDRGIY